MESFRVMNRKNIVYFISLSAIVIFIIAMFTFSVNTVDTENKYAEDYNKNYRVYAIPIPEEVNFAGEPAPIDNFEIRERFDRELLVNSYWQSQTLLFFKRAHRWFPIIEPILEEYKVPDDVKYIALIESGLMNVVSPAGATGYWQIMESTGKELGLEINNNVDERYHVEKATVAACIFLLNAYDRYENWTLAAAAYNMGRNGLNRQLRNQRVNSYYDLLLNAETSRYVFRILAVKTIFENPQSYGFHFREKDLYEPYDYYTVEVDSTITDLVAFAHHHQVTAKELRVLNPWLRQYSLNNIRGKMYQIKIPNNSLFNTDPKDWTDIEDDNS